MLKETHTNKSSNFKRSTNVIAQHATCFMATPSYFLMKIKLVKIDIKHSLFGIMQNKIVLETIIPKS
jgi:hypothetical protein